jgi:AAA15 family ATPase/GTPase
MLIEFSVENYRSFKNRVTLSMVAAEEIISPLKQIDRDNTFQVNSQLTLLKSAAIYGANASGKSNLAQAINFMFLFMINSSRETQSTDSINVEPFRLSTETETKPSVFELIFIMKGKQYRYGFELDRNRIFSEWLYYIPNKRETRLFERHLQKIEASKKYNADGIAKRTRDNALFLSVCAQFNVEIAENILNWLNKNIKFIQGQESKLYLEYTVQCLSDNSYTQDIIELIKKLDLNIDDIKIKQKNIATDDFDDLSSHYPKFTEVIKSVLGVRVPFISTKHKKFDNNGSYTTEQFDFERQESRGTQKLFALSGILINALKEEKILIIDELDASLHPLISRAIIELFNSSQTNPHNSQLIFMTHDTNLLSPKLMRRDQIWFTEKNRYGASDLYSLAEYDIPEDISFEDEYIKGRYGAIPYLGNFDALFNTNGKS